jgi:hypothetical protein
MWVVRHARTARASCSVVAADEATTARHDGALRCGGCSHIRPIQYNLIPCCPAPCTARLLLLLLLLVMQSLQAGLLHTQLVLLRPRPGAACCACSSVWHTTGQGVWADAEGSHAEATQHACTCGKAASTKQAYMSLLASSL